MNTQDLFKKVPPLWASPMDLLWNRHKAAGDFLKVLDLRQYAMALQSELKILRRIYHDHEQPFPYPDTEEEATLDD